jgi:dUTP pyrophosphatase
MSQAPQEVMVLSEEVQAYIREQIRICQTTAPMEGFKLFAESEEFIPVYNKVGDSGFDLRANIASSITVQPGERVLIGTGLYTELPIGFEIQVRPRSGMAKNQGGGVVNAPGTIDSNYRHEIGVIFINTDRTQAITINRGDRIAQGVICRVERINFQIVPSKDALSSSERGIKGFGSSGIQ